MREIKFRGKRIDNGEWVYGYLVKTFTGKCFILTGDDESCNLNVWGLDYNRTEFVTSFYHEVIPETVGQYIGLKDDKRTIQFPTGKKVYEGDILKCYYDRGDGCDSRGIMTEIITLKTWQDTIQFIFDTGHNAYISTEVINNIHDRGRCSEK